MARPSLSADSSANRTDTSDGVSKLADNFCRNKTHCMDFEI